MHHRFNDRISYLLILSVIIFLCGTSVFAQTRSNLDVFNILVDSSVVKINNNILPAVKSISLNFKSSENYSVFRNRVILDFSKLGRNISNSSSDLVNYTIEDARVNYGNMFKDGMFGEYFLPRTIKLDGSFTVEGNSSVPGVFNLAIADTVSVDNIASLENDAYPFTRGKVPSEPFFSSLFAPVVAIGSAALAVILFFTVRSK